MYNSDLLDEIAPSGRRDRAEYDDPWNYEPGSLTGLLFDCSGGEMDDRDDDEGLTDEEEQELAELDARTTDEMDAEDLDDLADRLDEEEQSSRERDDEEETERTRSL